MTAIKFRNSHLFYLDQRCLPLKEIWRECRNINDGYRAVKQLRVRGAPLIGVFSAYCLSISLRRFSSGKDEFFKHLAEAVEYLKSCRPTAVNLFWALERVKEAAWENKEKSVGEIKKEILKEAKRIHREDINCSRAIANYGYKLIKKGERILTHCNSGFLAASGEGTALAVIYKAYRALRKIMVYVDETRPLLQGARLTSWELVKKKIPCRLICDNMAAFLIKRGMIDKIFVGADRIVANGDVANKIGTYNLAVLAKYHKIPFYVAAPFSSFDLTLKRGEDIPIEERAGGEVRKVVNKLAIAPLKVEVCNPAFDVTPQYLITAIITDKGIVTSPFKDNIKRLLAH